MVAFATNTDKELIEFVKDGNHHAFSELVTRYGEYFYRISYLTNRHNAEDIVQQAFLKLWEHPYKYNPESASFKVWFCRVIINQSIDFIRARKVTFDITEHEIAANNIASDDEIAQKRKQQILEKGIAMLPNRQKTALNLVVYEEMTYEETAEIMKTNTGAIKSLIVRAKENLRKYIGGNSYA